MTKDEWIECRRMELDIIMLEQFSASAQILEKAIQSKNEEELKKLSEQYKAALEKVQVTILLFGTDDEQQLMNKVVAHASNNRHKELKEVSAKLLTHLRDICRKQLRID